MKTEILPHVCLTEAKLSFHPERTSDCDIHPLNGLLRFGPYSSGLVIDPIRVATIAPAGESERLFDFMRQLNAPAQPRERREYLPKWPGFRSVFGLRMQGAARSCHVQLDTALEKELDKSSSPHVALAARLSRAIQSLDALRAEFDVLFIYIPQRWSRAFKGGPDEDFDLHDHIKAMTATRRMPVQLVREDSALAYSCRASVMWRIGLALYVKAGGVPWKLADTDPETAYIGLSYAIRPVQSTRPRFVTCCSQVFDADGAGLEFIAYDADTQEVEVQRDNPFLSRTEMFRVMTRSMDLYRRRHAGHSPRRIMVHKTTEFKSDEIDGCMEAFHLCEAVDLVQVVEDVSWRGIQFQGGTNPKGAPTPYPVSRGTLIGLSPTTALLWTHGSVTGIGDKAYFQGARGTPKPLRIVRHAGHGPWDDTAFGILGLSKMDWNNDALYDALPVTLEYAKVLARVVKRMDGLGSAPYQFRFFM